jgi:putative hemolysin
MRKAESLAFALSPFIVFISKLLAPAVWFLTRSTNGLLRLFGIDPDAENEAVTEEEIRLLIEAGSARGSIASGEKEIINNVFEFDDITAEEVMTHRRDAAFLRLKDKDREWERIVLENRHSYYPVCGENIDDIRGVLCARDYLGLKDKSRSPVMANAVKPAQLVPNTVPANVLFRRMKSRRNHFAVVVDEYGSVDGIVTMNDLLEALVGDLADSEERAELPAIEKKGPGLWRINGGASLDKVAAETGAALPVESYDTFGGYVFTLLGRIPEDGEKPVLEDQGLSISVTKIKDRRLVSAIVRKS